MIQFSNTHLLLLGMFLLLSMTPSLFSVTREDTTPLSFSFNTDGSSMYVLGGDNDTIFQYTLATPWDVSTAEFGRLSVSALSETSAVASFKFDAEGTKSSYWEEISYINIT